MTRQVPVYRVEYAFRAGPDAKWEPRGFPVRDPGEAEQAANMRRADPKHYACVNVVGPQHQEMPDQ